MKIYHNPRCRKSREALNIIQNYGVDPEIVLYLEMPPTLKELKDVLDKLGMGAGEIVRREEKLYKQEYSDKDLSDDQWLRILADNPKLIQRPIVVKGKKAVIGRPPESVQALF
ncbi:MAG: arsenate reductase (glutaredoxin) [Saprospiraceae bacterium]|nr:arsenate reductase (glutaredoxin) [Saprospiraceae bacterium]